MMQIIRLRPRNMIEVMQTIEIRDTCALKDLLKYIIKWESDSICPTCTLHYQVVAVLKVDTFKIHLLVELATYCPVQ